MLKGIKEITKGNSAPQKDILEDVLNYSNLKMLLSRKLNRVLLKPIIEGSVT